ncbi:MAG: RES family NAD+ phosphorylase [Dehalococcoidia bacterium]
MSGVGAALAGGRWNSRGRQAIYTADSLASAALEVLVHLEGGLPAGSYVAAEVQVDDDLPLLSMPPNRLPVGWDSVPADASSVGFGDEWLAQAETVGLIVPSVIVRGHKNVVLNPAHERFAEISVIDVQPFTFDRRLLFRLSPPR